jgi:hypothetical protein
MKALRYRWDSSVALDTDVIGKDDELMVAGLRKSIYSALQSGWMPSTPDKRLDPTLEGADRPLATAIQPTSRQVQFWRPP